VKGGKNRCRLFESHRGHRYRECAYFCGCRDDSGRFFLVFISLGRKKESAWRNTEDELKKELAGIEERFKELKK